MTQVANYTAIRDGFITKARTLTSYFVQSWQVTDDEADVNRGAKYYMILRPGAVPVGPLPGLQTKKMYRVNWNITFDLQVKYTNFKTSWNEFTLLRDAVLNKFAFTVDKSLAGVNGIWDITITAPEPPGQKPPEGAPAWVGQQMTAIITQDINVLP